MFWETLWPLILGFGLSGAVQTFVSRDAMQRRLGDHRPGSIARPSATAWSRRPARTPPRPWPNRSSPRGPTSSPPMVFMFASTNLVIELGIVLVVLMGWQFAVSEFVGGIIMIVLLATLGRPVVPGACDRRGPGPARGTGRPGGTRARPRGDATRRSDRRARAAHHGSVPSGGVGRQRHRTPCRTSPCCGASWWSGYVVAGFLAVLVPTSVWQPSSCTATASGPASRTSSSARSSPSSASSAPSATCRWPPPCGSGGISFGGVISFIFADLITFPLLLIYRRYYGTRLMLRMLAVFWALMSTAGLVTEGIFCPGGGRPRPSGPPPWRRLSSRGTTPPT